MIFVLGDLEYAIPLSVEDEAQPVYALSDPGPSEGRTPLTDLIFQRMSHAWKLRMAKRTLLLNRIPRRVKWKGEA
jgi:hypothetical protein